MKIQTSALISELQIGDRVIELPEDHPIDLEFSAIDTGGGFKDPILDFSFILDDKIMGEGISRETHEFQLKLKNPQTDDNAELRYQTKPKGDEQQEVNGRLKEEQLSRELIGFVLKLLR